MSDDTVSSPRPHKRRRPRYPAPATPISVYWALERHLAIGLGIAIASGWLLYVLAPILTPFLAALLLAYLGDGLVKRLEQLKLSRTTALIVVFAWIILALFLVLLLLVPLLAGQLSVLLRHLPSYLDWLQIHALPWLYDTLGVDPSDFDLNSVRIELARQLGNVGTLALGLLTSITISSLTVLGWLINFLLIPVITFYLLRDWSGLVSSARALLPRRVEPVVSRLAWEADQVLGAFLKGQFVVMLVLGSLYSLGLTLAGLDFALLIGLTAGLVSFVPYLGIAVGLVTSIIAALLQFHDLWHFILVLIVFGIGQLVEGMVLTPLLVGEKIGLHPVAVIFAVLAGGQLFGFFGILLALPAAAVIMVILRHSHDRYLRSALYGE